MNDGELILVVDDEPAIVRALSAALRARKHRVTVAMTGAEALDEVATRNPAVVILDLGLPDIDGIEVCKRLRRWTDTPIIVLTAEGAESRKVEALDEGADDYVTKPFSTPELLARVRVALRHRSDRQSPDPSPVLRVGEIEIDIPRHQVTIRGVEVELTPKEFAFLAALARHPGRVLTHRTLLREVWGPDYGAETQYLRVYASHLRRKLDDDPSRPYLLTEPGVGYRLVDPTQR
ncbi:MAG: response regulator transcription factor [Actinomycetota bacterium]|nr:response regulator transcription factor [Actinomycetota bacterium]